MYYKGFLLVLLFVSCVSLSQVEKIRILEKKQGKRLVLQAQNTTQDTLNVFLMVHANGYRRSAEKPIVKNIPPQSTLAMTTLIELSNVDPNYTYDLIVNEQEQQIDFDFEKETIDVKNILKNKIVIFTLTKCSKCTLLTETLTAKHIQFRAFNIKEDPIVYQQFMALIEPELTEETKIKFPIVWNRSHTIFGFDQLKDMMDSLTK